MLLLVRRNSSEKLRFPRRSIPVRRTSQLPVGRWRLLTGERETNMVV